MVHGLKDVAESVPRNGSGVVGVNKATSEFSASDHDYDDQDHDRGNEHFPSGQVRKLMARFVRDGGTPDGSRIPAGQPFTKAWVVRNETDVKWTPNCTIVHVGGDALQRIDDGVAGPIPPHLEAKLSVVLTAPSAPGRYVSYFRVSDMQGHRFGQRLRVDILVSAVKQW